MASTPTDQNSKAVVASDVKGQWNKFWAERKKNILSFEKEGKAVSALGGFLNKAGQFMRGEASLGQVVDQGVTTAKSGIDAGRAVQEKQLAVGAVVGAVAVTGGTIAGAAPAVVGAGATATTTATAATTATVGATATAKVGLLAKAGTAIKALGPKAVAIAKQVAPKIWNVVKTVAQDKDVQAAVKDHGIKVVQEVAQGGDLKKSLKEHGKQAVVNVAQNKVKGKFPPDGKQVFDSPNQGGRMQTGALPA